MTGNVGFSWNVTESCPWLSVNPSSGSGSDSVTISYDANTASSPRNCDITVTCGSETKTVTVNQDGNTGISEISNPFGAKLSPNPFKNFAVLTFEKTGKYQLVIRDILGREINSFKTAPVQSINIVNKGMKAGVYFYTLIDESGNTANGKFIVE